MPTAETYCKNRKYYRKYLKTHFVYFHKYRQAYYLKNKKKLKIQHQKYYFDHRDEILLRSKTYYQTHKKDYRKRYRKKHPFIKTICEICGIKIQGRNCHQDHNHITGGNRGKICSNCNRGLGMFKAGKGYITLLQAVQYIQDYSK